MDSLARKRLYAASVVGSVLCALLGVWAWRMRAVLYCNAHKCYSLHPNGAYRLHPLRAEILLVTALVLALGAVGLHRPWRAATRQAASENTVG